MYRFTGFLARPVVEQPATLPAGAVWRGILAPFTGVGVRLLALANEEPPPDEARRLLAEVGLGGAADWLFIDYVTWAGPVDSVYGLGSSRELWLQHAAGFIVFEDVRRYAMERIDPALPEEVRAVVQKGIDDAVYGLMMIIDGVTGGLSNSNHSVYIDFIARFAAPSVSENTGVLSEIDLRQGDGMCMGYHSWIEGDFGIHAVAAPRSGTDCRPYQGSAPDRNGIRWFQGSSSRRGRGH